MKKTLETAPLKVTGEWLFTLTDGKSVLERVEKNLVVQAGLNFIADLLINGQTNNCACHVAYGTGTTAAAAGDKTLEAEAGRLAVTTKTRNNNTVKYRFFFTAAQANGTWTEWGVFMAGTDTAFSGTLLNRVLPSGGITKTTMQVLTIEVRLTIAAG